MDPELSDTGLEALNKLVDDAKKLNQQWKRIEESMAESLRIQAAYKAPSMDEKLDRMIALLETMMPTPKSESEPELCVPVETDMVDAMIESVGSASAEMDLSSIDVTDKSDSAIATSVFEDDDLDVSTIDSTQAEVISVHSSSMSALSKKEIKNEKDGLEFGNTVYLQSWYSSQPLKHTPIDFKPVLVLKIDDKRHNSKAFEFGTIISRSLNFCTETVRRNACEIFPFFLPPAKPPDECLSLLQVYSIWCCTKCWDLALSSIQDKELLVWIETRTCASILMMEYEALLSCYHMLCLLAGATKFRWPKKEAKKKIEIEYTDVFDKQISMHLPILLCEQIYKKRKIFVPLDLAHMNWQYPIRKEFLLLKLDKVLENYNNFSIQRNVDNDNGHVLDEAENLFGQVIGGQDKLVMNMKKGEVTLVTIAPENDFGYVESQHDMIAVTSNSVLFHEDELESFDKKQTSFDMKLKETIQVAGQADVIALKEKGVRLANEMIRESMLVEHDTISNSGYAVSGVLSSSKLGFTSRSERLLELLDGEVQYVVYKLDLRSCAFIDINGGTHEQGFDINGFEQVYRNKVIGTVCRDRLVDKAKFIVFKLVDFIKPEVITYRFLIECFCNAGDLIEACKLFNLMADQGIGIDVCSIEKLMEIMHKQNQFIEAFKLFQAMSMKYSCNLGLSTYKILIHWLCKRGIKADNATLSYLVYGHLAKSRISETYGVLEGSEKPEISIYHGLIKGLLRLKKPSEATQVFRAMIRQGCEPTISGGSRSHIDWGPSI